MAEARTKEIVRCDIQTILKTAIMVWDILEEDGKALIEQLEQTAVALQRTYGLDNEVIEKYHNTMETVKEIDIVLPGTIRYAEAEQARETIYAMCDQLDDPKEIMRYVRTAREMLEVWYPERCSA